MPAEQRALLDGVPLEGDDPAAAAQRAPQGLALLAQRFGGTAPVPGIPQLDDFGATQAEAAAQAARLWSRMAEL
jgi:hypothetical protein